MPRRFASSPGISGDRGGRGEARLPRGAGEGGALAGSGESVRVRRQVRRARRAAVPDPGRHGLRPRSRSGWGPGSSGSPRAGPIWRRGSGAPRRDPAARARPHETHRGPHAELLLGLPAQRGDAARCHGEVAWGSPGCHSFASIIEQPERHIVSMTQLGGEGLPWIGLEPYTDRPHIVQNVGDGSLFHSSLPQHPLLRGGRRQHDLQDPLQRVRREHRRPGDGRRKAGAELTRCSSWRACGAIAIMTKDPDVYRGTGSRRERAVEAVERIGRGAARSCAARHRASRC